MRKRVWAKKRAAAWVMALALVCAGPVMARPAQAEAAPARVPEAVESLLANMEETLNFYCSALSRCLNQPWGPYFGEMQVWHSDFPARYVEDLIPQSDVMAYGTITAGPKFIEIDSAMEPDTGNTMVYSEYEFAIDRVVRGEPYAQTVTVRVKGGMTKDWISYGDTTPFLKEGDRCFLFLYNRGYGGDYETQDDYYNICLENYGTYVLAEDGRYRCAFDNNVLLSDVETSELLESSLDPDRHRKEREESYTKDYEGGFTTKEQYEKLMAQLDMYGKVLAK